MKHQLPLRRLLLYFALFAVGCGLIRFGFTLPTANVQAVSIVFGMACMSLSACGPTGHLVAGKEGELRAVIFAIVVMAIGMSLGNIIALGIN